MKKKKFSFLKRKKEGHSIPKNKQEEQFLINPNRYHLRKKINNIKKLIFVLSVVIIIFITLILIVIKYKNGKNKTNNTNYLYNKNEIKKIFAQFKIYYNTNIKNNIEFSKYKNMFPRLTPDINEFPPSLEEIFNARQIYIPDVRLTQEYLKFIRPINETEEEKYNKPYSKGKNIIDKNLFKKRPDQYDYKEFCKIALEEKLIDENNIIEFDNNKSLISIIIPSYNKRNILLKSIRSIQNQKYKNLEIIIVNDCSNDNSSDIFNYLLETEPRIRIFHHMKNMGCWRTRLDGIIYSRGEYIILFDAGDLYADNYVLEDAYNVINKYNLDSCKFLFRLVKSFDNLTESSVNFHIGLNSKIAYEKKNIVFLDFKVFYNWGNIWNRLVRANIFSKAIFLLNELTLNLYKNVWDDKWFNKIINRASYSYAIFERVGYIYLQDGKGEGSPQSISEEQKNKMMKEYVGFLYYDFNFADNKTYIVEKLRKYDKGYKNIKLKDIKNDFNILNDLLQVLIKDPSLSIEDSQYCKKLLNESTTRQKELNKAN